MTQLVLRPNRIAHEIDGFFNDFFGYPRLWAENSSDFMPRVNVVENDETISLKFELSGLEKDDIKVNVKDRVLTVSGERKVEKEEKDKNFVRTEIRAGSFSRSFTLPETVDSSKIKADYKNGILDLTLTKREEAKPREIEVKVS